MKSLETPGVADALRARLEAVTPEHRPRWGRMTPLQMLAHLGDAAAAVTGQQPFSAASRTRSPLVKFVALRVPLPWPRNLRVGNDPAGAELPSGAFERERGRAIDGLAQIAGGSLVASHPIFGPMSRQDWMRWAFLHTDHHLRQFGV